MNIQNEASIVPAATTAALVEAGIAMTPQRMAVLSVMESTGKPLTAAAIARGLAYRTRINRVTIYRTITLFRDKGIIREITPPGGVSYFEIATGDHPPHAHFNCTKCKTLTCLTNIRASRIETWIGREADVRVEQIDIQLRGLCGSCATLPDLPKERST